MTESYPKPGYIDGMVDWQDPLYQKSIASLPAGAKPGDYITSLEVTARKPDLAVERGDNSTSCCGPTCCAD